MFLPASATNLCTGMLVTSKMRERKRENKIGKLVHQCIYLYLLADLTVYNCSRTQITQCGKSHQLNFYSILLHSRVNNFKIFTTSFALKLLTMLAAVYFSCIKTFSTLFILIHKYFHDCYSGLPEYSIWQTFIWPPFVTKKKMKENDPSETFDILANIQFAM